MAAPNTDNNVNQGHDSTISEPSIIGDFLLKEKKLLKLVAIASVLLKMNIVAIISRIRVSAFIMVNDDCTTAPYCMPRELINVSSAILATASNCPA
jgi:hypothetical protein